MYFLSEVWTSNQERYAVLKKINIVGITQGVSVPSTRFRWSQYADDLNDAGFEVHEHISRFGAYPPASHNLRPAWFAAAYAESLLRVLSSNRFDVRFLQRNLISRFCTLEPLLKKPLIFDVDDAIFLGARGASANRISKISSLTICGNDFLANHFSDFGSVVVVPTAVDTLRYSVRSKRNNRFKVIGWSGSSSGFKYLYEIESVILSVLKKFEDVNFKVVADKPPLFKSLPKERVVFEQWSADKEVEALQEFSIGIMPLEDSLWARGKCSFKMLTYMAVGIPVVVSPVGMNAQVLSHASCGFGPKNHDEWVNAISALLESSTLSESMGSVGRKIIEERYAKNVIGPKITDIIKLHI